MLMLLLRLWRGVCVSRAITRLIKVDHEVGKALLILIPIHPENSVVLDPNFVFARLHGLRELVPGLPVVIMKATEPLICLVRVSDMQHPERVGFALTGIRHLQHPQQCVGMVRQNASATINSINTITALYPLKHEL